MSEKKTDNNKKILTIGIIVALIAVIVSVTIVYHFPSNKLSRALDLGNKYLYQEMWEEAKVEFNKAIEIEPNSVEAYLGLSQAYIGLGDIDGAIGVLEKGYEITNDGGIGQRLTELKQQLITGDFKAYPELSKYDSYGHAHKGIMIVGQDNLFGAVDYDNNVIVPLKYSDCCYMANDEGQTWFGDENGYYVFDKDGNLIFETKMPIDSVSEGVVLLCGMKGTDYIVEYVTLEQEVLYSITVKDYEGYDIDIVTAVNFSEGKAFAYAEDYSEGTKVYDVIYLNGQVEDVIDRYYQVHRTEGTTTDGFLIATTSVGFAGWPIGSVNDGYFTSRIFDEVYITSADVDDYHDVGLGDLFYYSDEGYESWSVQGYYKDGTYVYNNGTLCNMRLDKEEISTYALIDAWSEGDKTLGMYDYLSMKDEKLWLISQDEKWGYIDHTGNVVAMYDDAADFNNGTAVIIENGIAYKIDGNLTRLNLGCDAETVICYGELWGIKKEGMTYFVQ